MLEQGRIEEICKRWLVSVERYGMESSQGNERRNQASLAVYGEVELVGRILIFVISRQGLRECYREVLENCIFEIRRELGREFERDMRDLATVANFDFLNNMLASSLISSKLVSSNKEI